MKILVPFGSSEKGGSQLSFLRLADAMDSSEYQFSCWLFSEGPFQQELAERGIPCCLLPRLSPHTPWGLLKLSSLLKQTNPDLIYLHASRIIALLAKRLGTPCIERINMSRIPEAGGWSSSPRIDCFFTNLNTRLLAVSEATASQLQKRGIDKDKITVIRNFVDSKAFQHPELRQPMRKELGIPEDAVVILNIGRMVPQKAQADYITAAARCITQDSSLHFILIGDGPLKSSLVKQIDGLGSDAAGSFHILPYQNDIARVYAASDILLHTAHWDPLANVLLEAMAAGLAVVATDVDGTREAVSDDTLGILFDAGDIETAAGHILALSSDAQKRRTLAANASAHVEEHFSVSSKLAEYEKLFKSV